MSFMTNFDTGHEGHLATTHSILSAGYYCPIVFRDVYQHIQHFYTCQVHVDKGRYSTLPLQPVVEMQPVAQWGMDFIGMMNPPSLVGHR